MLGRSNPGLSRRFHAAGPLQAQILKPRPTTELKPVAAKYRPEQKKEIEAEKSRHAKRNAAGVQLLSRVVHQQVFKNCSFPAPPKEFVNISLEHLNTHKLRPSESSTLPSTEFTLPPLQGSNLLEHFHRIGLAASEPYLSLATQLAANELPPKPENWDISSPGWTKYIYQPDGSSYTEPVPFPIHNEQPEQILVFDVETMPKYHQFPIIACAASQNAWYTWISPWILNPETEAADHLIPFGDPATPKIIVGHNVAYDRARVKEEYHLHGSKNRFLDTMSLHIAVKGISSNQRPAWIKHRKKKEMEAERKNETFDVVRHLRGDVEAQLASEPEGEKRERLVQLLQDIDESIPQLEASLLASNTELDGEPEVANSSVLDEDEMVAATQKRWEDITSANSLLDVAKLHCGIDISKEIRNDFMTSTPAEILENLGDYMSYCASDVDVTHRVYQKVLPDFFENCPHPVSFAGVLTMGSGFLPVNEEWEAYLERAEGVYNQLQNKVKDTLAAFARAAVEEYIRTPNADYSDDPWLSQLDWTPKGAGKTRGVGITPEPEVTDEQTDDAIPMPKQPKWYTTLLTDPFSSTSLNRILPLLLQLTSEGQPLMYSSKEGWHYSLPPSDSPIRLKTAGKNRLHSIMSAKHIHEDRIGSCDFQLAEKLSRGDQTGYVRKKVLALAEAASEQSLQPGGLEKIENDPWLSQLNWSLVDGVKEKKTKKKASPPPQSKVYWPKWYWDLTKPKKDLPPGSLDITIRNQISPILLKMSWHGFPLFHSRQHGWTFRVPTIDSAALDKFKRSKPVLFTEEADESLNQQESSGDFVFYKLPHKDGDSANVGSPLGKTFMKFAVDGILRCGAGDVAEEVVDVGVQCSYWVSARDRVLNQMVAWQNQGRQLDMGFPVYNNNPTNDVAARPRKWGMILPQVITMGTVTRRAIEKTWLTASNAKKNRVGSELKAMVRAPPGYAIVGADVDSEELWISSCMGDAQFGFHGATAIGWMTLEGTKSAGTDLHSKTASILGITRDQAKVFNYSRIYGAGMRHAMLLLLQGNSNMLPEQAQKLADNLYASTKGKNTHRTDIFDRKFWYGGTESFLFNKLEEIATSGIPQTPALGCGVTRALSKEYLPSKFGADYLPSRINWVVQSSGVDYLHLLIVSMDYLIKKYHIQARYLISIHDELRYLVKEEDRYRAALALQIANLWTRSMFAYKLGMDDLPESVAYFSAVDIDTVLRKEVDMPCITPSQPNDIPPGESMTISKILELTNGGSLMPNNEPMPFADVAPIAGFVAPDCLVHRAKTAEFLRAQATDDFAEIKHLARQVSGQKFDGGPGHGSRKGKGKRKATVGDGNGVDWSDTIERLLKSGRDLMYNM